MINQSPLEIDEQLRFWKNYGKHKKVGDVSLDVELSQHTKEILTRIYQGVHKNSPVFDTGSFDKDHHSSAPIYSVPLIWPQVNEFGLYDV